jgi:two-component system NarL family sensor kinase
MHQSFNNEIIIAIIAGTIMLLLLGCFISVFVLFYQKRRNKHTREKHQLTVEFKQTLLQSQLEIQEQTMLTISQEIHDNIGQVLSLAKLNLGTIDLNKPETLTQKITDSRELVGKAIQDLRNLAKGLNTSFIKEMGLLRSIEYELDMVRRSGGFITRLNTLGIPVKLDTQKELILFRIVQEVFNNIIKHAEATELLIEINFLPGVVTITITDNGKGFDFTLQDINENPNFGLGLRNMQSRAQLVGAQFNLTSIPRIGTTVILSLPFSSP